MQRVPRVRMMGAYGCRGMHRVQRDAQDAEGTQYAEGTQGVGEWEQPIIFQYGNEGRGMHRIPRVCIGCRGVKREDKVQRMNMVQRMHRVQRGVRCREFRSGRLILTSLGVASLTAHL